MEKDIKEFENKVIQGDCLEVMRTMPENSVDTVITDPPYDLSTVNRFKAKDSGENWNVKSGVFHRTSKGFMGKEWDGTGISFKKETWEEVLRVAKPGATLMAFGGTRTYHRMAYAIEDAGWIIKDTIMWIYGSGFPKATDLSLQFEQQLCDRIDKEWYYKGTKEIMRRTSPFKSEDANKYNGWKSHGLKPAYEPIIMAMKSNEGTYAENALKWGVSGLNIDGGRIGNKIIKTRIAEGTGLGKNTYQSDGANRIHRGKSETQHTGRFPANLILDEESAKMLDEQTSSLETHSMGNKSAKSTGIFGDRGIVPQNWTKSESGGASRFFKIIK